MHAIFNHTIKYKLISERENPFKLVVVKPDIKRKKH